MTQELTTSSTTNILDSLKEGVIVVEGDGIIQYLNRTALDLLELEREPTALYEAVAPYESWQELLRSDAPSHLYMDTGRIEVQASSIEWQDKPARQLILSPVRHSDWTVSEPAKLGEQLASLNRISLQLGSTLRLTDVLRAVIEEALSNTGADGGRISLFDRTEETFIPRFSRGVVAPVELTADYEKAILKSQQGLIRHKLSKNQGNKVCSVLISPILYEGFVAGLISLHSLKTNYFDEQTQIYVQALANHAAIAIGNAQRFDELNKRSSLLHSRAQQIERFVESSRVLHGERPLSEVYEDLVYAIQEGVGFQIVVLNLIDEDNPSKPLQTVSAAGLPIERLREIQETNQSWKEVARLLRSEFSLGAA
jgi:hypothetical protein